MMFTTLLWNYNQVPNQDNEAWTAGDNDVSYDLPVERMWFFNDSFYGNNKPDQCFQAENLSEML